MLCDAKRHGSRQCGHNKRDLVGLTPGMSGLRPEVVAIEVIWHLIWNYLVSF